MCDMLPADMRLREHILQMIKTSYASYGFMQIETPVMEHIENLTSKQGGDNEKLIFKVMKRGADLTRAIEAGLKAARRRMSATTVRQPDAYDSTYLRKVL